MAAKERESAVSEMANWSKAVHSEMQHQKNWHQNWHYLSKDAGPASMTDRIQGLKDQLAKASEGKSMPGFFTTNSEIGDTTTKGQQDVQETERIGTERIWHGRHNSPDLTPSNPYG